MKTIRYKSLEFFILFIVFPISMALDFLIWIKLAIGLIGFAYIIFVLLKVESTTFKITQSKLENFLERNVY